VENNITRLGWHTTLCGFLSPEDSSYYEAYMKVRRQLTPDGGEWWGPGNESNRSTWECDNADNDSEGVLDWLFKE
jgi:hypothetical protein